MGTEWALKMSTLVMRPWGAETMSVPCNSITRGTFVSSSLHTKALVGWLSQPSAKWFLYEPISCLSLRLSFKCIFFPSHLVITNDYFTCTPSIAQQIPPLKEWRNEKGVASLPSCQNNRICFKAYKPEPRTAWSSDWWWSSDIKEEKSGHPGGSVD